MMRGKSIKWNRKLDAYGNTLKLQNPDKLISISKNKEAVYLKDYKYGYRRFVKKDSKGKYFMYKKVKYYL